MEITDTCEQLTEILELGSKPNQNECFQENESKIELYFYHSNLKSLMDIHKYSPKVTVLTVIGQPLKTLVGLQYLEYIKELWVVECKIKDLSILEVCHSIEKMYLYSNSISHLPNMSKLINLKVLWLSGNNISSLKEVEMARTLEELNISNNNITKLDGELYTLANLHTLNLSGNPLFRIKDMYSLSCMPKLTVLQLTDPMYGSSPVTKLCNYRTFMVYHLPNLENLDTYSIDTPERCKVEDFYRSKVLYYSMVYHHVLNSFSEKQKEKEKEHCTMLEKFRQHHYAYTLQHVKQTSTPVKPTEDYSPREVKIDWITKMHHLNMKISVWNEHMEEWHARHFENLKMRKLQLNMELQNSGNLTFTVYSQENQLLKMCQKLLNSYTCFHLYSKIGILGTKVLQVTQVYNKGLELMCQILPWNTEKFPSTLKLFTNPIICRASNVWPLNLFEDGFSNNMGTEVEVTDCLYFADSEWLDAMSSKNFHDRNKAKGDKRTVILVQLPKNIALARLKVYNSTQLQQSKKDDSPAKLKAVFWNKVTETKQHTSSPPKVCSNFSAIKGSDIMPIYIVEYEYLFEDPLESFKQGMGWTTDIHDVEINIEPEKKYPLLDNTALKKFLGEGPWNSLTSISLVGVGIESIDNIGPIPRLTAVDFSYNKLKTLKGLEAFPLLSFLDVSYNSIHSLTENMEFPQLKELNLAWNYISELMPTFKYVNICAPEILSLNVVNNPSEDLIDIDHIAFFAHLYLPKLVQFNDTSMEQLLQRRPTRKQYSSGRLDNSVTKPLVNLYWTAERYELIKEDCVFNDMPNWISYKNMNLTKMQRKDFMELRWADFSYNLLYDIEFLKACPDLEELSLSHNVIKRLNSSLTKSIKLVKLDLSHNYLKTLKPLYERSLPSLKLLDVSNNLLEELAGIDACPALQECYASNNKIFTYDGILYGKNCHVLRVLDVSGNNIVHNEEFRNLVVFYFNKIEYLNGYCIQDSDIEDANQIFGGSLDQDYLLKQYKDNDLQNLTTLTLSQCALRKVALTAESLPVLRSLDVSYNNITSLWGFRCLHNLRILCLSFNQVSHFCPTKSEDIIPGDETTCTSFAMLETLYINNNELRTLKDLSLYLLPSLKTLFAQDNDLTSIDGLQSVSGLQHLILDRNNIQNIMSDECLSLINLQELYLEGNRLKYLYFTKMLKNIQRLFLANNRINDSTQIRHLSSLDKLQELTLMGNPLSLKNQHYGAIMQHLPILSLLDGHPLDSNGCQSD